MCFGTHEYLEVDDEFRLMIPKRTPKEEEQLEANIVADGEIREPLIVWGNLIVDGMGRYKIARKHNMAFDIKRREFRNKEECRAWMLRNQLGRRNLTDTQISMMRGELLKLTQEEQKSAPSQVRGQNGPATRTAAKVAKETGTSENTVKRDAKLAEAVKKLEPEVREAVVNHDVRASRAAVEALAEKPAAEQKVIVQQVKDGKAKSVQDAISPAKKNGQVVGWTSDRDAEITSMSGKLMRLVDERGNATGKDDGHSNCIKALRWFGDMWKAWRTGKK